MPEFVTRCTCPHCGGRVGFKDRGLIRKKIRCPKCQRVFLAEDPGALEAEEPQRGRKKASSGASTDPRGPLPEADDENSSPSIKRKAARDDDDDRPRKRRKKKQKSGVLLWILLGGGGIVIAAAVVLAVVLALRFTGGTNLPTGWKEVLSSGGRFRAAMPAPWVERTRTMPSPAGPVTDTQYVYEVAGGDLNYSITYADFSASQLQKLSLEQIIDAGRDAITQKFRGSLEVDRQIDLDGHRGREVVIHVPGRGKFVMHYYIADSRLYTIGLAGSKAALDIKEARVFFGSFRFTDKKK